ncbi:hypothetical protein BDQ94DRAFT_124667 [Aspergillus welwitschiae]|uniref:Uncharacterized protein n=1 Tax=Aspergillus welwitschiae TaxID=1341132 RepID=A0A3F3Q937_9EURO|nr:hypothetical protein BDQ94DRAFT_124667 [Aspergillus welwitschiae]RDH35710.1 hypothetical protein BDQ94DRAFT_124667 [Aspergillus welwitschiae]
MRFSTILALVMLHLMLETTSSQDVPLALSFFFPFLQPISFPRQTLSFSHLRDLIPFETFLSIPSPFTSLYYLFPMLISLSCCGVIINEALVVIDSSQGNGFMNSRKILTFFSAVLFSSLD